MLTGTFILNLYLVLMFPITLTVKLTLAAMLKLSYPNSSCNQQFS